MSVAIPIVAVLLAAPVSALLVPNASVESSLGAPNATAAALPAANPWLSRRDLNIAHQGGELEAPSNTMYAYKTAVAKGADVLELDVHRSAEGAIVAMHDATVDRTTDGAGRIDALTVAQLKALDAAYWFVPDVGTTHSRPAAEYSLRGIATGHAPPPSGFAASDFTVPTLREVLETFPDMPINIEVKATAPDTMPYERDLALLLHEFGRTDDAIVVSFTDVATELFKAHAPDVSTAVGTAQAAVFWASAQGPLPGAPNPRYHALQVPITFQGLTVVTPQFVERAHASGLAVHVWTVDDRTEMEWLLDIGVDGIMTNRPTVLEQVLAERTA